MAQSLNKRELIKKKKKTTNLGLAMATFIKNAEMLSQKKIQILFGL